MNVKTDTKEKFVVITPLRETFTANMSEEIMSLASYATELQPHIVLNLKNVKEIDAGAANLLEELTAKAYESSHSFLLCELTEKVKATIEEEDLSEILNTAPTESEAADIVQMEQLERDLLDDFPANE